jgi:hypothetical protein
MNAQPVDSLFRYRQGEPWLGMDIWPEEWQEPLPTSVPYSVEASHWVLALLREYLESPNSKMRRGYSLRTKSAAKEKKVALRCVAISREKEGRLFPFLPMLPRITEVGSLDSLPP